MTDYQWAPLAALLAMIAASDAGLIGKVQGLPSIAIRASLDGDTASRSSAPQRQEERRPAPTQSRKR